MGSGFGLTEGDAIWRRLDLCREDMKKLSVAVVLLLSALTCGLGGLPRARVA